jgi:hypothetical protein
MSDGVAPINTEDANAIVNRDAWEEWNEEAQRA